MARQGVAAWTMRMIVAVAVLVGGPGSALASAPPSTIPHMAKVAASGPAVSLSPNPLDFGARATGTARTEQVILQNTGDISLTITGITVVSPTTTDNAPGDFSIVSNGGGESAYPSCSTSTPVAPGSSCSIFVRFTPADTGSRTATLRVDDNASDSPQTVALSGTGRPPAPRVSLGTGTLDFGDQAINSTSYVQSVYVSNYGEAPLTFDSIGVVASGDDNAAADYQVVTQTTTSNGGGFGSARAVARAAYLQPLYRYCAGSLAPGDFCYVYTSFTPSAAGPRAAHLQLVDDDATVTQTVALSGTGRPPAPSVSYPSFLTFRAEHLGQSDSERIYVHNTGDAPLTLSDITVTASAGDNAAADFTLDTSRSGSCSSSTSLTPYNSCSIYVTFAPSDTGARVAHLRVTDNATGSPHTIALSGKGAATSVAVTPASLDFGRQQVGSLITRTVTLTNTSGLTLTNLYAQVYPDDYNHRNDIRLTSNSCPNDGTLLAGASCTADVTFAPSVPATETGVLDF